MLFSFPNLSSSSASSRFLALAATREPAAQRELWQSGEALEQRLAQELVDSGLAGRPAAAHAAKQATGACWLQRHQLAAEGSLDQWETLVDALYRKRTIPTSQTHNQRASATLRALLNHPDVVQVLVAAERQQVAIVPGRAWQPVTEAESLLARALWTLGSVHVLWRRGSELVTSSALTLGEGLYPVPQEVAAALGLISTSAPDLWATVSHQSAEG